MMNSSMIGGVQDDIIQRGSIQDLETQLSLKQNDLNQLQQQNSALLLQKAEMYESYLNEKQKVIDLSQKLTAMKDQESAQAKISELERKYSEATLLQSQVHQKLEQAALQIKLYQKEIKNLRLEQRVMSGVLHNLGKEFCFGPGLVQEMPNQ